MRFPFKISLPVVLLFSACIFSGCFVHSENYERTMHPGGPRLGSPGGGPVIDKSGDEQLQAMIQDILPRFAQMEYLDSATGIKLGYNLFTPANVEKGRKYPLVMFMADASTPGTSVQRPLVQGYGALVWATSQFQKEHPCYVLVPQFSGVAVNDAYEKTPEVDVAIRLLKHVAQSANVDSSRLYATGQSMGGMISMYFNIAYPDVFAASIFVDCHWDISGFSSLARRTFTYITAGNQGKSAACVEALEEAAKAGNIPFAYAQWSAKLPQTEQDELAAGLFAKGDSINIINFTSGSVLPADGRGSEHMYSFDFAYRLAPVREWLFKQSRKY